MHASAGFSPWWSGALDADLISFEVTEPPLTPDEVGADAAEVVEGRPEQAKLAAAGLRISARPASPLVLYGAKASWELCRWVQHHQPQVDAARPWPSIACAHIVIETADDHVVFVQRGPDVAFYPGAWSPSIEEQVEVGSVGDGTVGDTARRGLYEELAVTRDEVRSLTAFAVGREHEPGSGVQLGATILMCAELELSWAQLRERVGTAEDAFEAATVAAVPAELVRHWARQLPASPVQDAVEVLRPMSAPAAGWHPTASPRIEGWSGLDR